MEFFNNMSDDAPQESTLIREQLEELKDRFDIIEYVLDDEVIKLLASYFKQRTTETSDIIVDFISLVMHGVSIAEIVEFLDSYDVDLEDTRFLTKVTCAIENYLVDFNIPKAAIIYTEGLDDDSNSFTRGVNIFYLVHGYEEDELGCSVKLSLFLRR